jgi:histidinol-phosphate aminotransferase
MSISRRSLLRRLGVSAVAGAAVQSLGGPSVGAAASPREANPSPILLSRNENPYGPSEKVLAVIRNSESLSNRYPRTEYESLVAKIAALHGVKPEQVALGCGSNEILRLAASAFLGPGKKLVQASPTCPALGKFAHSLGAEVGDVPINKTYEHNLGAMLLRAGDSAGLVYICNPNNPTGSLTPRKDIEAFVRELSPKTMVLIDEAYHHFVSPNTSYASFLDRPIDDPRVMVVRTFSKVYGLAGMRVGYVVAAPDVVRRLSADHLQFGVSLLSARAAAAALDDSEYVRLSIRRNADDRQEFMNQLNVRMLRGLDSHANFVLMNPLRPTDQVIEHLKKHNILIGPAIPAMDKYIRVSLGTTADMEEFWHAWDQMSATDKMEM